MVVVDTVDFGVGFRLSKCDARALFSARTRTSEMVVNIFPKERIHYVLLGLSTELEGFVERYKLQRIREGSLE